MQRQNYTINRGTTIYFDVNYAKNGEASTLVGATLYMTVKDKEFDKDQSDTTSLIKKTVSSHTDAANGKSVIKLSPQDTWIKPGNYYYDIQVKESNGDVYELSQGRFTVDNSSTNRSIS